MKLLLCNSILVLSATVGTAFTSNTAFTNNAPSLIHNLPLSPSQPHPHPHLSNTYNTNTNTALSMAFESTEEIELDVEERYTKTIENLKQNLQTIRTGRASPSILDLVQVEYYGAPTPLNQMASISVPNSQQLNVEPFDKSTMADVEKAIMESGLGLTPNNDGNMIRINIPQITEDRRKELLKSCKALGEDSKVAIRNVRRDGVNDVKKLEKASEIGEDESQGTQEEIQKITDKYIKEVDAVVSKKEKEVMTV